MMGCFTHTINKYYPDTYNYKVLVLTPFIFGPINFSRKRLAIIKQV